ncbi:MAG: CorA family divalent cation transporter [Methanomicrobiales archaeon]|nr:CorA family divalent cation transporter [Methanomicrobiales archaeon]
MQDGGQLTGEGAKGGENRVSAPFEDKGFCAAIDSGKTKRLSAHHVADLCSFIGESTLAWIDYVVDDFEKEAASVATSLGFSEVLLKSLLANPTGGYEDFETEMGILLPAIYIEGFDVKIDQLVVMIRHGLVVTLHTKEVKRFFRVRRYAETLLRKIPQKIALSDKMTLLLIRIIDENNSRNFDYLRGIEEKGDMLSKKLADSGISRIDLGKDIYEMKHALIVYLGGLWSSVDTLNTLRFGDAELLTDDSKILNRITALIGEVNSHIGLAEHLSEVLASGLEVLQSIYNNQLQVLNNRMALLVAYLTIIGTAILVPNTIATVAGNPMFNFSSADIYWYIPLIVVSTILATVASWWAVKRLGLLPKSPE